MKLEFHSYRVNSLILSFRFIQMKHHGFKDLPILSVFFFFFITNLLTILFYFILFFNHSCWINTSISKRYYFLTDTNTFFNFDLSMFHSFFFDSQVCPSFRYILEEVLTGYLFADYMPFFLFFFFFSFLSICYLL